MAHAALVSLARTLELIEGQDRDHTLFGDENNVESLNKKIKLLLNFVEDLPEKLAPVVRPIKDRIRDAAYELEDHIERHAIFSGSFPLESEDPESPLTQIRNTHTQGIKSLLGYIDSVLEDPTKIKNIFAAEDLSTSTYTSPPASGSSRNTPNGQETMVGVQCDLIQIKDRVTSYELNLQIIPITGTGGIGKTTLARNVFEDPIIIQHFDIRSWVTVSQEYNLQELLQGLLPKQEPTEEKMEMLIERVYKSLKNRRYLIVLDDIWHGEVWDRVRRAIPNDYNGSRVIITTRLSDVAAMVDSSSPLHQMQYLNEDQSWALLREKVCGQEHCPQQLEEVGKIIARKCKGLPLTIVVISGLLKVNKTKDYWDSVAKNINEAVATNDDDLFAILSLSYCNLPHHLKACFLYMGIFPEDYRIPISKLIKLWVAEGFLKPARSKSLEEVAEEYLEDLVNRNLILVSEKRSNGKIRFCSIHDVLRELSVKKGHEEKFLQHYRLGYTDKYNLPEISNVQRRLIIHTTRVRSLPRDIYHSPVRSVLYFSLYEKGLCSGLCLFTSSFLLLRVVDGLVIIESRHFPHEIFNLVHLRFLAFFCSNFILYLPSQISKLKNLETFIIEKKRKGTGDRLVFMPSEIWKMPQLRHLVLNGIVRLPILGTEELGESYPILHNLQTLRVTDFEFTKEMVESLPNLKKLRVRYIRSKTQQCPTYYINNLVYLQHLQELNFELPISVEPNISNLPQGLKKLTMIGSRIPWEKMSIVVSLPNLEVLKLKESSVVGREWEVTDDFLNLKHLELENIDLEDWIVESNHFPCLERLIIRRCCQLKEVPESIGDVTTLQILTVKRCNPGVEESVRKIQEQQQSMGNDDLKVHLIPVHELMARRGGHGSGNSDFRLFGFE